MERGEGEGEREGGGRGVERGEGGREELSISHKKFPSCTFCFRTR